MAERPAWLRVRAPSPHEAEGIAAVRATLRAHGLSTICQGAKCPNQVECWGARAATFLLLGDVCTRACRFCGVAHAATGEPLDPLAPQRVARAAAALGLRYVVLTSVDRDDLADGGAGSLAATVRAVRDELPAARVEVLLPDFGGDGAALATVVAAGPDVLGHNLETVRRITPHVRDRRASYDRSLRVLAQLAATGGGRPAKSGLMLGLGETLDEVREALRDLRAAGVVALTLGQYLPPSARAVPVARYVPPETFDALGREARELGFSYVASGPLVRSSYHAEEAEFAA